MLREPADAARKPLAAVGVLFVAAPRDRRDVVLVIDQLGHPPAEALLLAEDVVPFVGGAAAAAAADPREPAVGALGGRSG